MSAQESHLGHPDHPQGGGEQAPKPFWETKTLEEMTPVEWESICDGCARCCLYKLQDADTGEYYYTNVVCRLLDMETCRCTAYNERSIQMPSCIHLTIDNIYKLDWLPGSCAYRLLIERKPLPSWHPLVSGRSQTIHDSGMSVRGIAVPEEEVDMSRLEDYIVSS